MGVVRVPKGIKIFPNHFDFAVSDRGKWYFAALAPGQGCIVWEDRSDTFLLQHPGQADYGSPRLHWDHIGRLIMSSCNSEGTEPIVLAVPNVSKSG
jgi:photosystem II stability/assembly factor-like uncharacterized protein